MTINWEELLQGKVEDAKKPDPFPAGVWLAIIKGHKFDTSRQKQTPYVQFSFKPVSPESDVDPDALARFGGIEKATNRELTFDFYLTEDFRYRLKDFLEKACQINISGRGWTECIGEAAGKSVKVQVTHSLEQRPQGNTDPNWTPRTFANISDFAAA